MTRRAYKSFTANSQPLPLAATSAAAHYPGHPDVAQNGEPPFIRELWYKQAVIPENRLRDPKVAGYGVEH